MRFLAVILFASAQFCSLTAAANNYSTAGIEALVKRRIPQHADSFVFTLAALNDSSNGTSGHDRYKVSNGRNSTIHISGNTPISLAYGLRWYLSNILHVDVYWFIGSRLQLAPPQLPRLNDTHHGESTVQWRYHFNTVTFSYTSAFWDWTDWELQLDWMALRGINLPLAWVGYEKILGDVLRDTGLATADITSFLSGPAFQAWNRFGNIRGSWGGELPSSWVDAQFNMNKRIVARMVELGMTPVLPSFTGFVPASLGDIYPNASIVVGSQWSGFPSTYTNVSFLEPSDLFTTLQKAFISKQIDAYGDVTNIYTLDQYNENDPFSGDLDYLKGVSSGTVDSLKAADPDAIWLLQGWLFYSSEDFWTNARVEAYLSGVDDADMMILDLFSESQPQWQRTNSYFGKNWIWCQLHDYGGNMGLYGQIENITINPVEALANSTTMVGMGLTMEGQEGNEIMYDLLLDQAWSKASINATTYFHNWANSRYAIEGRPLPHAIYAAWDILRVVYNNTDLAVAQATTKSIFELSPNTTGLLNVTGHHPTTIPYDSATLVTAWKNFYHASTQQPSLWANDAYTFDLTDITRQVLANAFYPLYIEFVHSANSSLNATYSPERASKAGEKMIHLLKDLDAVLFANGNAHFSLADWIASARSWTDPNPKPGNISSFSAAAISAFYEYDARNQITLWGPTGEISGYASKQWAGLIKSYYVPRWQLFIDYTLNSTTTATGQNENLAAALIAFEEAWQLQSWGQKPDEIPSPLPGQLPGAIERVTNAWPEVFG